MRGDTQRGFINMGGFQLDPHRHPLIEHPNRGKRSVGIDVSTPGGQEVLYELAKTADVFLTNYMPAQRQKNKFDVEHIRAANPNIIYARGSAYGDKGAERDTGGFDGTAFWTRSGVGHALTPRGARWRLGAGHSGVRRLDRRDEHRRRDFRRAVSSRTHGRGGGTRRLAVEHGVVGGGREHHAGHGDRRDDARHSCRIRAAPTGNPVHRQLSDLRRRHHQPLHRQPDGLHPRRIRASWYCRSWPTTRASPTCSR